MLVLTLNKDGKAVIDLREFGLGLATVTLLDIRQKTKARIGFDFDGRVPIHRKKIWDAIERERKGTVGQ